MTVRVGINGFGRIGRNFFRAAKQRAPTSSSSPSTTSARSTRWPTCSSTTRCSARCPTTSRSPTTASTSTATTIKVLAERDPKELPWGDLGVDVVVESTGFFTDRDKAAAHLEAGAPLRGRLGAVDRRRRHLRGAASTTTRSTRQAHKVVSNASCTTNCFVPHGQGARRRLRRREGPHDDGPRLHRRPEAGRRPAQRPAPGPGRGHQHHPDLDRRRPRHGLVLESMKGKLDGTSLRVPVPDGSITDFVAVLQDAGDGRRDQRGLPEGRRRPGRCKGMLEYTRRRRSCRATSSADPHCCIFDAGLTMAMGNLVKVLGWYDNEWGYSNRLVDLVAHRRRSANEQDAGEPTPASLRGPRCRSTASGCCCAPTSTSRSRTARSPTTSASAPRCPRSSGCSERGAHVIGVQPPRPAQGQARPEVLDGAGARRAWPSWRPASSCSRTCASTRARRPTTRRSSPSWSRAGRLRQRRLRRRRTGPTPRSSGRRSTLPSAAGRLLRAGGRGAARPARRTRSARSSPCSAAPRSATSSA